MCLILFAWKCHAEHRLVVAANRDEFFERPSRSAHFWPDQPQLLAGRDLRALGTWLGVTRAGRFAAITNFRNPAERRPDAPSRGTLVTDFLNSTETPGSWLASLGSRAAVYNGFSMLASDGVSMCFFSNRDGSVRDVAPGVHGLSNHLIDTPWPKVRRGTSGLAAQIERPFDFDAVFTLLADTSQDPESELPDTGIGLDWERKLSAIRIMGGDYGTRCSTVLRIGTDGDIEFRELNWLTDGTPAGQVRYAFRAKAV